MRVVTPLPHELDQKFQGMALINESLMLSREYARARQGFEELYQLLYREQTTEDRYHKGYPLHQTGISLVLSGKPQDALYYFIVAYIEDLLSQDEGQEDRADQMPAGRTLRQAYKVQKGALTELKKIAQEKKRTGRVVRDPKEVFDEMAGGQSSHKVTGPTQTPQLGGERRLPGRFDSTWERRVFVGGNYRDQLAVLNEIKSLVKSLGYDPVLALDFDIPEGMTHHHSLMLLHECSRAIFEISSEAGQLMEIERLRDYQISPLIIYQSQKSEEPPRVTLMLRALLTSLGHEPKAYLVLEELDALVKGYLLSARS